MQRLSFLAIEQHIERYSLQMPLDVLVVGATGVGKSSTINALAGEPLARIGFGVAPETMNVSRYQLDDYFQLHDSAGLGDGTSSDVAHREDIARILRRLCTDSNGRLTYLIDLVLVILDASTRDLGTAYKLVSEVVLTNIEADRVVVVINQADMAMKGRGWLLDENRPGLELVDFVTQQAASFQGRIKESTGLSIRTPVHYSALKGYNLQGVLDFIVLHLPKKRRRWQAVDLMRTWTTGAARNPGGSPEGSSA